jgi:hypothetical protein
VRRESLELLDHALEHHHAIGEPRMLLAEGTARERVDASVVGGIEQSLEQLTTDQPGGAGDQSDLGG